MKKKICPLVTSPVWSPWMHFKQELTKQSCLYRALQKQLHNMVLFFSHTFEEKPQMCDIHLFLAGSYSVQFMLY